MENTKMSEKLEKLMFRAKRAREEVMCGRYTNGSYSSFAGQSASLALAAIELELHNMMKDAIRIEAEANTKDQIIAQFTVQIC
jgi:hypothetical protein